MLETTRRTRRILFTAMVLLTACVCYEGEGSAEINTMVEEQAHFRHETYIYRIVNWQLQCVPNMILTSV